MNVLSIFIANWHSSISQLTMNLRLIYSLPPWVPTTSYLTEPHWLPVKARVEFNIYLLVFKFDELSYLVNLLNLKNFYLGIGLRTHDEPFLLKVPKATFEH